MKHLLKLLKKNRTIFMQLLFTILAFTTMVFLSYFFMSSIVRGSLVRNAEGILDFAESQVNSGLFKSKNLLANYSETLQKMIQRGDSTDKIQEYISNVSDVILQESDSSSVRGLFIRIERKAEEPVLIHGDNWPEEEDHWVKEQTWYRLAVENEGKMIETPPEINSSNDTIFTYAECIFDNEGNRLGVVGLDVYIDHIADEIIKTTSKLGGYGMLVSQDFLMLAHPNEEFINKKMSDPMIPVSIYIEELEKGNKVSEEHLISFREEPSVAFFRKLSNGWFIGMVSPEKQYYQNMSNMAAILILLGFVLAMILVVILIRIDAAKTKSYNESRQKSAFLANMSHEIRTPINAIVGMTTIGKNAGEMERKDYCFCKIEDASQHLLGVINDILDMSKVDADKFEIVRSKFSFSKMLERVEDVISFRVNEKEQKFVVKLDEDIPEILIGDEKRLMQVMINILSNAVKFTQNGGSIYLNTYLTSKEDNVCTITVEIIDTGIGIAPEVQEKIFEPFEQGDSGISRKFGGTGLGLVISKRIVELMGGSISVSSKQEKGSKFTFSFQAECEECAEWEEQVPKKQEEKEIQPGEFSDCHIILAEDMEINQEIILVFLEETKAQIDCAENGHEVLALLDKNPDKYSLIFMDVQMPEMDGLEATKKIRARGINIPIVAMTANVFKEDIDKCLEAGMDAHLGKPLDMYDVVGTIRKYCLNPERCG